MSTPRVPHAPETQPPVALTIAGSDPSGGAGIQADLKTFTALGVYGASVLTALTAQNTHGVRAATVVDDEMVQAQLDAVLDDLTIGAVKTGMLATDELIALVARVASERGLPNLVVDPVMIATSGDRLLDAGAEDRYRRALIPLATIVTPNLQETEVLVGRPIRDLDAMIGAAHALRALGCTWALVKGGHLGRDALRAGDAVDVLAGPDGVRTFTGPRIATTNTHGTGCTLAAAIAARLASGDDVPTAVGAAKDFVAEAIASAASWRVGTGNGPIDHLVHIRASGIGRAPGAGTHRRSGAAPSNDTGDPHAT